MDARNTRDHIEAHAQAVVNDDREILAADLSDELRPQADELAKGLPLPVAEAEVLSVEVGDEQAVAEIHYTGENGDEVTIRSTWEDHTDHPVIVHLEPVE